MTTYAVHESAGTAITWAVHASISRSFRQKCINGADLTIGTDCYAGLLTTGREPAARSFTAMPTTSRGPADEQAQRDERQHRRQQSPVHLTPHRADRASAAFGNLDSERTSMGEIPPLKSAAGFHSRTVESPKGHGAENANLETDHFAAWLAATRAPTTEDAQCILPDALHRQNRETFARRPDLKTRRHEAQAARELWRAKRCR
jgi:hypothetical protein